MRLFLNNKCLFQKKTTPKDHEVPQESILLATLLGAPTGFHAVAYAFPRVRIVTSAVDPGLDANHHIVPGFGGANKRLKKNPIIFDLTTPPAGNFGDRYYGMDASGSAPA